MGHNIRKVVTVHESTVKRVAKGEAPKYGKKSRRKGSKNSRVITVQALDPLIVSWMKANHVKMRDIETVVSPTQIILK